MKKEKVFEYCNGMGCGLRQTCSRFKENIEVQKEYHFAYAPVQVDAKGNQYCQYQVLKSDIINP